jgi:hypothetical protein
MISTPGSLPGTTKSGFAGDGEIPRSNDASGYQPLVCIAACNNYKRILVGKRLQSNYELLDGHRDFP